MIVAPKWLPPHLKEFYKLDDLNLLASCLYGETGNDPYGEKVAIACVIRNRVRAIGWWGDTYKRVILSPAQFPCFDLDSPRIAEMRNHGSGDPWKDSLKAAAEVLAGCSDMTDGATHYLGIWEQVPEWMKRMTRTRRSGQREFYKDYDTGD